MSFYEKISKGIKQPKIMGILNLTPDSFFDGGKYNDISRSILKINQMISDGADIIDIGAVSTRPGSKPISYSEEKERLIPTIKLVRKLYPKIVLSVDTFCFQIAQDCIDLGVDIINNVNLFYNETKMMKVISQNNTTPWAPQRFVCCTSSSMHMGEWGWINSSCNQASKVGYIS